MKEEVKEYYGKILKKSKDLKTNACCTKDAYPKNIKDCIKNIHEEVVNSYYGCGLVIPDCLDGCTVLDLGCGSGMDVYILSQLVGAEGKVIGIDMTKEQLDKAEKWKDWHSQKFGYSNVEFVNGYIEDLGFLENNSIDIIISNCVINLCPDKELVLREIFRVVKKGGEFYFSDVYSSRRIPKSLREDSVLWGECLSGALYWNDFLNLGKSCGFEDIRLVKSNKIEINNKKLEEKTEGIDFYSATYRLFKLPKLLESDCEDYGQAVIYQGTIENNKNSFILDSHHIIETDKVFPVCGNTWNMLKETRFKKHFKFIGDFNRHYGIFDGCGKLIPFEENNLGNCC